MDDQLIVAGSASGQSCLNCGTILIGPYCQVCGQHVGATHRSVRRLAAEGLRSLTDSDGPLLRTLRRLAFNPAALTADYLRGKQASQIPPVRLFLLALAVFLVVADHNIVVVMEQPSAAQLAVMPAWVRPVAVYADAHGTSFVQSMHSSAELFAVLTVPIAALLLKLIYFRRRELTLYDHAIVAAYSLAFQLVMLAIILALPDQFGDLGWFPFMAMCAHLFAQMRGVYAGSVVVTLLRMAALGVLSGLAYLSLFFCWLMVAGLMVAA